MSSTAKNLQFLEAQLNLYLHDHRDDGTTLWTDPKGIRMPYSNTYKNLVLNMKYIEAQLEKYLHSHTSTTVAATNDSIAKVANREVTGTPAETVNAASMDHKSGFFYMCAEDNTDGVASDRNWVVFKINESTFAVDSTIAASGDDDYDRWDGLAWVGGTLWGALTEVTTTSNTDVGIVSTSGGFTIVTTFSNTDTELLPGSLASDGTYLYIGYPNNGDFKIEQRDTSMTLIDTITTGVDVFTHDLSWANGSLWMFHSNDEDLYEIDPADGTILQTLSMNAASNASGGLAMALYPKVFILQFNLKDPDFEEWLITEGDPAVTTLYTRPSGFRFPYDWRRQNAVKDNVRFLEAEISTYLHKHEEN